jgi:hypothetical protein
MVAGFPRTINTNGTHRTERLRQDDVSEHSLESRRTHGTSTHRSIDSHRTRGNSTHRSVESRRTRGTHGTSNERRQSTAGSNHSARRSEGHVNRAPSVARLPERNGNENSEDDSFSSTIRTKEGHFNRSSRKKKRSTDNHVGSTTRSNNGTKSINSEEDRKLPAVGSIRRSRRESDRAHTGTVVSVPTGGRPISITQPNDEEAQVEKMIIV